MSERGQQSSGPAAPSEPGQSDQTARGSDSVDQYDISRADFELLLQEILKGRSLFAFDGANVSRVVSSGVLVGEAGDGIGMFERLIDQIDHGDVDPRGRPLVLDDAPALQYFDGSSAPGPVATAMAAKAIVSRAKELGTASAVIKGGRELGHPAIAATPIAEAGLVGICATSYLSGDAAESVRSRVGLACPGEDGCVVWHGQSQSDSSMASAFTVFLSAFAGGHDPVAKASSANRSVAEHVLFAFDPERVTEPTRMLKKLSQFPEIGTNVAAETDRVTLDASTMETLGRLAKKSSVSLPW